MKIHHQSRCQRAPIQLGGHPWQGLDPSPAQIPRWIYAGKAEALALPALVVPHQLWPPHLARAQRAPGWTLGGSSGALAALWRQRGKEQTRPLGGVRDSSLTRPAHRQPAHQARPTDLQGQPRSFLGLRLVSGAHQGLTAGAAADPAPLRYRECGQSKQQCRPPRLVLLSSLAGTPDPRSRHCCIPTPLVLALGSC